MKSIIKYVFSIDNVVYIARKINNSIKLEISGQGEINIHKFAKIQPNIFNKLKVFFGLNEGD